VELACIHSSTDSTAGLEGTFNSNPVHVQSNPVTLWVDRSSLMQSV